MKIKKDNRMIHFWNLIFYVTYKMDYKIHLAFNKINPILFLYKMSFAKRHFQRKGFAPEEELNKAFKRKDAGISILRAEGFMLLLVFLCLWSIFNFYEKIVQEIDTNLLHFIAMGAIASVINYFLLSKKDRYLEYFKEFEKLDSKHIRKYYWITLVIVICVVLLLWFSYSWHGIS